MNWGRGLFRGWIVVPSDLRASSVDLSANEYLRRRWEPQLGDPDYLHLSDLLVALRACLPKQVKRVLDYGSGGSPYRELFEATTYHRADILGTEGIDFEFGKNSMLPAHVGGYDCVLSTQVLEHVENPLAYLRECHRVLSPGGKLVLTTHGIFKDHGCPYDYWRWTGFGLQQLVRQAGFKVDAFRKMTIGPRAALYLFESQLEALHFGKPGWYNCVLSILIKILRLFGAARFHRAIDENFPSYRVADETEHGDNIYICVLVVASRD